MTSPTSDSPRTGTSDPTPRPPAKTALDGECLRQALHDLRGPLNNATILLELVKAVGATNPEMARTKLAQTVHELHRIGRMLDQLAAASHPETTDPAPVCLHSVIVSATRAMPASARIEFRVGASTQADLPEALVSTQLLERALRLVLERCVAALPEGGAVNIDGAAQAASVRLTITAKGPRLLVPTTARPRLTDGSNVTDDWFVCWSLVRGMRGELHVDHGNDVGIRIAIDLPRRASTRT